MKTSTTAIIASVAVLIAVGMFYNSSSLNPKTIDNNVQSAFATGTTGTHGPFSGFFAFNTGHDTISKGKFIGFGRVGTADESIAVVPFDGSALDTLVVNVAKAPGTGKSWTFTVYLNGVAQNLQCTISGTAKTCHDQHDDIETEANDEVSVKVSDSTGKAIKKTTASATIAVF
jgi:hypothetical protein